MLSNNVASLQAEKLHANTLPFPYKSKEVYEQSIRMPLGPEYNPAISVSALNRPAVSIINGKCFFLHFDCSKLFENFN